MVEQRARSALVPVRTCTRNLDFAVKTVVVSCLSLDAFMQLASWVRDFQLSL